MSTYVGSRADEIAAVLREVEAGRGNRVPYSAPPAAGTASAETVNAGDVAAGQVGEGALPKRAYRDAVEHTRQCRLRSYQEQR